MNPIILLIQPLLRRGLFAVVAYLSYIGISNAQQSTLVDALLPITAAAILFAVDLIWSYFNRRSDLAKDPHELR